MKDRETRLGQMKREAGNYGFDYRMLDAREAREMLPGFGPAVVGASFTPYDGHVSLLALRRSLHYGFNALGGVYLPNVKITGIATAPRISCWSATLASFRRNVRCWRLALAMRRLARISG